MSSQLRAYADSFRQSQEHLHRIVDGLSHEPFNWKPGSKSWSIGECVVHLNTIAKGYVPAMREALTADAPRAGGPFSYGFVSRKFIEAVRPGSRPIPTAGAMNPSNKIGASGVDKERAMASFDRYTEAYLALCRDAEGFDLAQIKIRSPFLKLMRLPLGAFLDAMGQHANRHVQQAESVTQAPGFPA